MDLPWTEEKGECGTWKNARSTLPFYQLSIVSGQRPVVGLYLPSFRLEEGEAWGGGRPLWQGFLAPLLLVGAGTLGGVIPLWLLRKKDIAPYL